MISEVTSPIVQVETESKTEDLSSSSNTTVSQDSLSPGLTTLPDVAVETPSNDAGPSSLQATESTAAAVAKETAAVSTSPEGGLTEISGKSDENVQVEINIDKLSVQDLSPQREDCPATADAPGDLPATDSDESNRTEEPLVTTSSAI